MRSFCLSKTSGAPERQFPLAAFFSIMYRLPFLCLSCNFLLKIRHFRWYISRILLIHFPLLGAGGLPFWLAGWLVICLETWLDNSIKSAYFAVCSLWCSFSYFKPLLLLTVHQRLYLSSLLCNLETAFIFQANCALVLHLTTNWSARSFFSGNKWEGATLGMRELLQHQE